MVLDNAVRGRNHPDDVVVLKCPECRHTEPLQDGDINSFPINNKILEDISRKARGTTAGDDGDSDSDDEELMRKFRHVSMETTPNNKARQNDTEQRLFGDPNQTHPKKPYNVDEINLNAPRQNRFYPNVPSIVSHNGGNGVFRNSADDVIAQSVPYDVDEHDDLSYIDDVAKQLDVPSTDHQRNVAAWEYNENDDIMAAIRRSCDEMYGGPVSDLATDGDETNENEENIPINADSRGPHFPPGRGYQYQNDTDQMQTSNGTIGGNFFDSARSSGRITQQQRRQNLYQKHLDRLANNGFPDVVENKKCEDQRRMYWKTDGFMTQVEGKTEEEIMLRQLQIAADKNPMAADVLEDIMKVKTKKEAESVRSTKSEEFQNMVSSCEGRSGELLEELKQQAKSNPDAAAVAGEMEFVEEMRKKGYLVSVEEQRLVDQVRNV